MIVRNRLLAFPEGAQRGLLQVLNSGSNRGALVPLTLALCVAAPGLLHAEAVLPGRLGEAALVDARQRFIDARAALRSGNPGEAARLTQSLDGYVLQPYLRHEQLLFRWKRETPGRRAIQELNAFERESGDRGLTRRLTHALQTRLAQTRQWSRFLALKKSTLARSMPCTTLRARHETGQLRGFDSAALAIWTAAAPPDPVCRPALAALEKQHVPPVAAIWERIFSALEANQLGRARSVLHYLSSRDRADVERWLDGHADPAALLQSGALAADTVLNRRILADLVVDWSRADTNTAMEHWLKVRDDYSFYRDRYYDTHRAIAMRGAYRRLPEAHFWLDAIDARDDDLELMEWRVRTALLSRGWGEVLSSIARLPPAERREDHWAYWEARALEATGLPSEAEPIYRRIAGLQSWHGFLAADRLGAPYAIRDEAIQPDPETLATLRARPALVRAREFHAVGLPWEGRRDWNDTLESLDRRGLAAAAVLAAEWGLHDRAIFSAGRAEQKRALDVRFPLLYRSEVAASAAEYRVEPAWVFGVMRRESAYIADVKSSAGAIGLMQLMPSTADFIARRRGDAGTYRNLTDPASNIGFGSYYLRHVLDQFDQHIALATASYNAGPHRVSTWLPEKAMDADRWIDTIPFTETRRYVRAVLAYTAIYEWRLTGESTRLSEKLKRVGPS